MAGVREDDCEWEHGFHPLLREARGVSEHHEAENSAFQVNYSHKLRFTAASRRI
ncbi:hypothetical protein AML71_05550 [Escherichia coli]|uniref:Uncharacterized protein n=1 Tax=Shigella boydii TaxID=621 RepID=A0A1S9JM26_SHIBO|nr:hypothetical protein AWE77_04605 [Escherichia coli]KYU56645.1 hypothetical protein AML71_05550 [Escherichia coli]OOO83975.1 hypothetical protein AJR17_003295 [Shigella boydii]OWE20381.1 hypothetical protein A8M43_07915 [Escherichia coli]